MTTSTQLTEYDFGFVCELVKHEAAIVLEHGKEYLVESRLAPLAKTEGFPGLSEMLSAIRSREQPVLKKKIIEALTTNETSFFRDIEPFEAMKKTLLPELIAKRSTDKRLTIWSAAASTGQESYSICMMLRDNFPQLTSWNIKIIGTDINRTVLDKARQGIYSQFEINRGLPATSLIKHFEKKDTEWQIKPTICSMVEFSELNLIKPFPPSLPHFDFIFLRNVLIYFDKETKRSILEKIRGVLKNDGYLFLGASETTINVDDAFDRKVIGKTSCYFKK
jgi:chemotaxis protein methyltransferase CheR